MLRNIVLWCIIFLAIIIGYAFRFELSDARNRVLAVLIPSYNWVNQKGQIVVTRNRDGHFYLNVQAQNQNIRLLVDTGASDVMLTPADAVKLGVNLKGLKYTKKYSTANGISYAAPVTIGQLVIGDRIFNNIAAHVAGGQLDISLLGMSVIGMFKHFNITQEMLLLEY